MRAFTRVATESKAVSLLEVTTPVAGADEVLVRVAYCGICGSDIQQYHNPAISTVPLVLGHEISGVVEEIGSDVAGVAAGDRVAILSILSCDTCPECVRGLTNICQSRRIPGHTYDGGLADIVRVPASALVPVPDTVPLRLAALAEPFSVAIHAGDVSRELSGPGRVVISGPGPIGLLAGISLRADGWEVTMIGRESDRETRLAIAEQLGFEPMVVGDAAPRWQAGPPPLWIEASGSGAGFNLAIRETAPGGTVAVVGIANNPIETTLAVAVRKEISIRFRYAYRPEDYLRALDLLARGVLDGVSFVDDFDLERTEDAILQAAAGGCMKPVVRVDDLA